MVDIVERLNKLAEKHLVSSANSEIESLLKRLAESQARAKRHAELAFYAVQALGSCDTPERWAADKYLCESVALPSDSTALDSVIRQAKREALLEAITEWEKPYGLTDGSKFIDRLRRMADELKV